MFEIKDYVQSDLEYQENLQKKYNQLMKNAPEGRLTTTTTNGKTYYYKVVGNQRVYLGDGFHAEVKNLQRKYFAAESLKRIEKNKPLLKSVLKKYHSLDTEDIIDALPQAYKPLNPSVFSMVSGTSARQWGSQEYSKNTAYPKGLTHRTLKGDLVRSKSEVIIANALFSKNIEYHYEEVLEIDGHSIAPDFLIRSKGQQGDKIWEHFGLIGQQSYLDSCLWKIRLYLENGYRPWEDVIFTFDDQYGNINAAVISQIISSFCV